ncbi:predicted protein [Arabidopsis lyrata subsp. lyrata]|uniref:Predicted protein n=1 Tax=Arabidopsis lyrata subsp. lyrata TaxID=81972 RepID=D7M576_ARALL|nr:predicted protein [Arabidopsis lyrata subsp. lyrata]
MESHAGADLEPQEFFSRPLRWPALFAAAVRGAFSLLLMLLVVSAIRLAHGYLWRGASLDKNCGSSRRGCLALSVASFSSESCCWVSEICGSGGCSVHRRMGEILGSWWILSFGGSRINGRGLVSSLVG